jgi:hypothetical protein
MHRAEAITEQPGVYQPGPREMRPALSIAALELFYAVTRRSRPLFLANCAANLAFASTWAAAGLLERMAARRQPEAAFA